MKLQELNEKFEHPLRESCRVLKLERNAVPEGGIFVKSKTVDEFNFTFSQMLALDGETVYGLRCSCGARGDCAHLAAVISELLHDEQLHDEQLPTAEESDLSADGQADEPAVVRSMNIRLGDSMSDGAPIWWTPNDSERLFHTNTGIIGTMGTGKTQCTKSIVAQLWHERENNYHGAPMGILIFDYKGDYNETKPEFVQAVNARILKPYKLPFNPLALNRGKSFKHLLPVHTANLFVETLTRIFPLGPKQQQMLNHCILEAYHSAGIREENEASWNHAAPTFETVYRIFSDESEGRRADSLTAAMDKIHNFCLFEPDPRKSRSLADILRGNVIVMDLSQYDSDIQNLVVGITLNLFYAQMQKAGSSPTNGRYRHFRQLILVDEADEFMSRDFLSLRRIMKEGREFGVGVLLSTQSLSHFASEKEDYSPYVLTWIVHNVSDLKQRDVDFLFKLKPKSQKSAEIFSAVKNLHKHESLLKLGGDEPVLMRDLPFFLLNREEKATI